LSTVLDSAVFSALMHPSSFEWGTMLLCFKVCDPYDRVFSSLIDLLLAPFVPVHQYGLCVSVLILNWFQVTIMNSVFLSFFYKCGRTGLWALWTFNSYICPLYPVWGYHDLPSSTSKFWSPAQSHHVLQESCDGVLVGTKWLDIWWGILFSNPVLNILLSFGVSCVKHRLQTAYSTECCQFLGCLNSTREVCRLETSGHKCFPPLYKQVSGVCI